MNVATEVYCINSFARGKPISWHALYCNPLNFILMTVVHCRIVNSKQIYSTHISVFIFSGIMLSSLLNLTNQRAAKQPQGPGTAGLIRAKRMDFKIKLRRVATPTKY